MSQPLVTVYIPVYNGAKYLQESIDSIAAQTFTDWECILVDDCSTDESPAILGALKDPRFQVVRQPVNQNVANASNLALRLARGKYLARLDQDDIAVPERLEYQAAFLEQNADVAVCGAWMMVFGAKEGGYFLPEDDGAIKANLLSGMNTISNPVSMVRTSFLRDNRILNDPRFPLSCDYGMWVDCTLAGARFVNLQRFLARYRWHASNSSRNMEELVKGVVDAKTRLLLAWYPDLSYSQIVAAEPLLRANDVVVLSTQAALHGLEVLGLMVDPGRATVTGEDREAVRKYLGARADEWRARLDGR
jgi:glycosyltransferase involved in cell wall biosynthesis